MNTVLMLALLFQTRVDVHQIKSAKQIASAHVFEIGAHKVSRQQLADYGLSVADVSYYDGTVRKVVLLMGCYPKCTDVTQSIDYIPAAAVRVCRSGGSLLLRNSPCLTTETKMFEGVLD